MYYLVIRKVAILKSIGYAKRLETLPGFQHYRIEAKFLLQENSVLLSRPSADWMWSIYIKGDLLKVNSLYMLITFNNIFTAVLGAVSDQTGHHSN